MNLTQEFHVMWRLEEVTVGQIIVSETQFHKGISHL